MIFNDSLIKALRDIPAEKNQESLVLADGKQKQFSTAEDLLLEVV